MCRQANRDARWLMILAAVLIALITLPSIGASAAGNDPTGTSRIPVLGGNGGGHGGGHGDGDSSDPDDLGIYKRTQGPSAGAPASPKSPDRVPEAAPISAFWMRLMQELRILGF
jgi:hypothetical protein